ncbi:MAG TPA: quinate 5-dehydrogenase [Coriobacteriia bacterium]|nr:quinate 5-dehydrogenase [Coriobacteriia bacterium]
MDPIKEVVSVSIGSSKRDHKVEVELFGEVFRIWREGTDGDMDKAEARLRELDGKVDAFGLGGIDLFLRAAERDYYFRDAKRYRAAVQKTPIVDGSGLKGAVERDVVRHLHEDHGLDLAGKTVLVTSAVDRWGMTEGFYDAGCKVVAGDLLYALSIPIMLRNRTTLERVIHIMAPIAVQLPYSWLYEAEADHETAVKGESKHADLYREADIIAGDYKYVREYMPEDMSGKWVITNTTTPEDVEFLRGRGVELLVTSTPRLEGRSFGTNVIEATMVALDNAKAALAPERYLELLRQTGFTPDVQWLNNKPAERPEPVSEAVTAPAPASA